MISLALGERGEVVNTSGCEPDIREFDSHRSPQSIITSSVRSKEKRLECRFFVCLLLNIVKY